MTLEKYLTTKGLTQAQFARIVRVSQPRIAQLLRGDPPSFGLAQRIAKKTKGDVPLSAWAPVEKAA